MSLKLPTWPEPLFRHYLLLAWFAGIFASRFWWPGLAACAALFGLAFFRLRHLEADSTGGTGPSGAIGGTGAPARFILLSLLLWAAFGLGSAYALWRAPQPGASPDWLLEAAFVGGDGERGELYRHGLAVRGRVDEVNGLTDRRLQILLSDVRPLAATGEDSGPAQAMPGRLVLTWQSPLTPEAPRAVHESIPIFSAPASGKSGQPPAPLAPQESLAARPLPGQEVELLIRPRPSRSLQNPGLWEVERYWADREVWYRSYAVAESPSLRLAVAGRGDNEDKAGLATVLAAWRESLRQRVNAALPRDAGGEITPGSDFLPALLFGDRFLMDSADADLFARSTLTHSLALSGMHLGYAAALGYALAYFLFRCFPGIGLRLPKRKFAVLLALPPALLYLWLGGAPPSLVRSALMLFFWGLLLFLKKPAVLLDGLLWAVGLILLFDPGAVFDLRLQLSALAIAVIALCSPLLSFINSLIKKRLLGKRGGRSAGPARRLAARILTACVFTLGTSFFIQLALMPVLVNSFGIYGLAFPLNLLWLPVLGLVVMPLNFFGLAAAALHWQSGAELFFRLASAPCAWLLDFLRWLNEAGCLPVTLPTRPHWLFTLGFWLVLALLPAVVMAWFRQREARARVVPSSAVRLVFPLVFLCLGVVLCLLPLGLRHYETSREAVRLRLLDVGQGQAVLVEWPGGGRLLLDGGGSVSPRFDIGKQIVAATLTDNRPPDLDYMLASHPDSDHMQGLLFPLEHMDVGYYAGNGRGGEEHGGGKLSYVKLRDLLERKGLLEHALVAGQILELAPDLRLEILHPPAQNGSTGQSERLEQAKPSVQDGLPGEETILAGPEKSVTPGRSKPRAFSGNNASLVARLVWKGRPLALLCGDVEKPAQRYLLRQLRETEDGYGALRAEVIVLPHHGAAGASLKDFYKAVRPQLALASCGYANQWGFPSKAARASLRELDIPLMSTADLGQIIVEWNAAEDGPRVSWARPGGQDD